MMTTTTERRTALLTDRLSADSPILGAAWLALSAMADGPEADDRDAVSRAISQARNADREESRPERHGREHRATVSWDASVAPDAWAADWDADPATAWDTTPEDVLSEALDAVWPDADVTADRKSVV